MDRILRILSKGNVLNEDGVLVAEHFKKKSLPEEIGPLRFIKGMFTGIRYFHYL